MPVFRFRAVARDGTVLRGFLEAPALEAAHRRLLRQARHVLELELAPSEDSSARGVPRHVLLSYTQRLGVMFSAGIPLVRSLYFLAEGEHSGMNEVMRSLAVSISRGGTFTQALREHPSIFPRLYVSLVHAGELAGHIGTVLSHLGELLEREQNLRSRFRSFVAYPATLACCSAVVLFVVMAYLLPMLRPMFETVGAELPWGTRVLLGFSDLLRSPWPWAGVAIAAGSAFLAARNNGAELRRELDRRLLTMPWLGRLLGQVTSARLLYAMALMMRSGMHLDRVLRECQELPGNAVLKKQLEACSRTVFEGAELSEALARHDVFCRRTVQMLAASEASGTVPETMLRIAAMYQEEVDVSLERAAAAVEPLLLSLMGLVVGLVSAAALMPVVHLVTSF